MKKRFYLIAMLKVSMLWLLSFNVVFSQVDDVSSIKFSMEIEGHTLKIPIYSNHDLFTTNTDIDKAVIVIQGSNRNAGPYLENMQTAANSLPSMTANTLIVAPQFLIAEDLNFHSLDAEHLYWSNGGWKSGANSKDDFPNLRPERIPSYAVLDSVLLHLAEQFPNLESIVFTGHSAGGQVSQRMAATSPMADLLCLNFGISTRFVVINPSSYVYMDGQRREPGSSTEFSVPATSCDDYNEWKYGLEDLYTYPEAFGVDSIRNRYKRRSVTYLIGEDDDNPNSSSLDDSCEANLQGAHRLERGEIYFNYMKHYYGNTITANHEFVSVPNAGHNSLEMFSSPEGLYTLFEKPFIPCSNTVSTLENTINYKVDVFPNPATDILNVSIIAAADQNFETLIFDLQGRLMKTKNISTKDIVDISTLESGLYLMLIRGKKAVFRKKIMVY